MYTYCINKKKLYLNNKLINYISGILATIKNHKFIIYLFILHDVLKIINILSVQLQ